jgi:hypothetical protein
MAEDLPKWEPVGNSQALRVWQFDGPNVYPHVTLVRMSPTDYQGFVNDPASLLTFARDNNLFPVPATSIGPLTSVSFEPDVSYPQYLVTMIHSLGSKLSAVAIRGLTDNS